jgi:hypothetical protein
MISINCASWRLLGGLLLALERDCGGHLVSSKSARFFMEFNWDLSKRRCQEVC